MAGQAIRRGGTAVMARGAGRAVLVLMGGLVAACATAATPFQIRVPQPGVRPVAHVGAVISDEIALATMTAVVEQQLGLPALPVTFHFYPTVDSFAAVLAEAGHEPGLARDAAGRLRAIAGHGHVLVNESRMSAEWPDRLFTYSHEFTHCLQYALARGRRSTSDQWLREGFADAVAVRVLDRIGARPFDAARRERQEQFQQSDRAAAPRLGTMTTFVEWIGFTARADLAPGAQAFLAVERLIARHGFTRLLDYFAAFGQSEDRLANFKAAFDQDLAAFERDVDEALGIVRAP